MKSLMYYQSPFLSYNPFYEFPMMDILMPEFGFVNESRQETSSSFSMEYSLDGFSKKDISINVSGNKLVIEGKHDNKGFFNKSGRTVRRLHREILLSENMNTEDLKASFKKGVLRIEIPKRNPAREIPIWGKDKGDVDVKLGESTSHNWLQKVKQGWQQLFTKAA